MTDLLRSNITECDDEVIGTVLSGDTWADWLCDDERSRWRSELAERRSNAMAWAISSLIPTAVLIGAIAALAWFPSTCIVIAALAALSIFIPILGFTLRMAGADIIAFTSLRRRGHSEVSTHILEIFGGSVWMLGRKGLYFTRKPAPLTEEDRKVDCVPYSALAAPRISHFPDMTILVLSSEDGYFVTQLIFRHLSEAEEAAKRISKYLGGPRPPRPRKHKRPPGKPGSSDPGFSLPAIWL